MGFWKKLFGFESGGEFEIDFSRALTTEPAPLAGYSSSTMPGESLGRATVSTNAKPRGQRKLKMKRRVPVKKKTAASRKRSGR